jgi:hypothetical protein
MKVYYASFEGPKFHGTSVVTAQDEAEARIVALAHLRSVGIAEHPGDEDWLTLDEIPTDRPRAHYSRTSRSLRE